MTKNITDFALIVTSFLTEYLPLQRNYSKNTVLSYKDALKLFARFLTENKSIRLIDFTLNDLNRNIVIEYLEWLRKQGSSVSTTNQRLAAIKTFSEYAGLESIEYLAPLQGIQAIKSKKDSGREIVYLTVDQIKRLINTPDINTAIGLRHRSTLTLLYDSGCRVQELCDIRIRDISTGSDPTVRLLGKGNKCRTVTLSLNTGKLLDEYVKRQRSKVPNDHPLIVNRNNSKITKDGIDYIIQKYFTMVRKKDPTMPEHIHPHCFRHSKAMHMLAAGINIVYIRDFLGHEDISTTMIYSRADNRLKMEAINTLVPKLTDTVEMNDWRTDTDLMTFLESFK